ncbi:MAG TPA: Cys-tRNA(Pro) deacylase [Desulfuromonadales bacterium]|nr:Cys-tRNA(Pro) deacylase [Desulfuromonadales bacterium]
MAKNKLPVTPAVRQLKQAKAPFRPYFYAYEEQGGTAVSARELGVDEHRVVKTLIMEDNDERPFVILMHGNLEVSIKNLARTLAVKSVRPCSPEIAARHTGYQVGGTSPFGTRKPLPVYVERSILDLDRIFINGGKRGFLVEITPQDLVRLLEPTLVEVGIEK